MWDKNLAVSFLAALVDVNGERKWFSILTRCSGEAQLLRDKTDRISAELQRESGKGVEMLPAGASIKTPGDRLKAKGSSTSQVLGELVCYLLVWLLCGPLCWAPGVEMQAEAGSRHSWRCWTWHMEGHDLPAEAWCIAGSGVLFTMPGCPSRSQLQATVYIWVKGLLVDDLWMDKRLLHFRKSSKSSKYLFSKDILRSEQPWICTW